MPDLNSKKNKHMTFDDRLEIQDALNHGISFKAIAERIGKDQTTISKEVKKRLKMNPLPVKYKSPDGTEIAARRCPLLLKAPFVCNPCKKRHHHCAFQKQLYNAKAAQQAYESLLSEAREGIPLCKEEFYEMDAILSNGIKKGQHLYHIMQTHDLGISKSTAYRHLHRGYLSVSALDFPRVVKFKKRRRHKEGYIPKAAKIGRTYHDFLAHIEEFDISSWVELDTVIGRIGGKVIMTFDFTFCNFMFGLLLEDKTAAEVSEKIRCLKKCFAASHLKFGDIFPLCLTDNGGEFANVSAIELDSDGKTESSLYFCDPYQSSQKPRVEKNHTLFRDIVPKGESFDHFTQETVNLIFSHVNSVKRKSLNGKTPFEMFSFVYSEHISSILGMKQVPADEVIQSPKLLNR
ncbi:transposase [Clostridia bacterium]|nr:transposase [Clostridia bacterium]